MLDMPHLSDVNLMHINPEAIVFVVYLWLSRYLAICWSFSDAIRNPDYKASSDMDDNE
jgi:hypothetical protein